MLIDNEKAIVPYVCDKDHLEFITKEQITDKEFESFRNYIYENDYMVDSITDRILDLFYYFKKIEKK